MCKNSTNFSLKKEREIVPRGSSWRGEAEGFNNGLYVRFPNEKK